MEVSQLGVPLVMVNGNFRNLYSLTVEELEKFVQYMTACSLSWGKASVVNGLPEWWVRTIQFKFPLVKPKGLSEMGYQRHLQSIVCRCYCHHDAQFLLSFSSKFSERPESIFLRKNDNNTTSVFSVEKTAEIFTFPNENKEYDKNPKEKPFRRCLLPSQSNKSNSQTILDIYLCENCDVEFYSLSDMQRHERECYGMTLEDLSDEIEIITHIKPVARSTNDQSGFLDYFGLCSKSSQKQKMVETSKKNPVEAPVKRWVFLNMCLHKNRKIEFSSLLGRKMLKHRVRRDEMTRLERSILSIESNCGTSSRLSRDAKDIKNPKLTYKKSLNKQWTHTYCFNKRQRIEKMKTFLTGLNEKSRQLLKKCKHLTICLQCLKLPATADFFYVSVERRIIVPYRIQRASESRS